MPHASIPDGPGVPDEAWSPRVSDPAAASAPIALAGYRDFVLVGSGGDSQVYRAVQDLINRPVAVKVLTGGDDGVPASRYQRELEITVRLGRSHPNIVTVLDTQILPDGRPCIVMEYYELGSLQDQLRSYGPLPASAVVAAGTVVADALAFAHWEGVLHRDVKPQNILVLPTSYVLADFGLARRIDAGHTSSLERFSYRHASPQVLDGELPSVEDDLYSLGSTLFTLLDGRPPFAADDPEEDTALAYLRRARSELPRPIRSSDATPELLAIIDRCLAKRREDRFPDAASLRDALRGVVTEARVWARTWQPQTLPGRDDASAVVPVSGWPAPVSPPPASPMPIPRSPAPGPIRPTSAAPAHPGSAAAPRSLAPRPPSGANAAPRPPSGANAGPRPPSGANAAPHPPSGANAAPRPPSGANAAPPDVPTPRAIPAVEPSTPRIITPMPLPGVPSSGRGAPGPATAPQPRISERAREDPVWAPSRGRDAAPARVGSAAPGWDYDDPDRSVGYDDSVGLPDPDRRRLATGWLRILVLAVVALVLGTALGLGGSWLVARLRGEGAQDPREPVRTIPTFTGTLPSASGGLTRDPALTPVITGVVDNGTTAQLTWTDPSQGQFGFVVLGYPNGVADPAISLDTDAGVTTTVVALDQQASQYCFVVAILTTESFSPSQPYCTDR